MTVDVQSFHLGHWDEFNIQDNQKRMVGHFFNKDYEDFLREYFYAVVKGGEVLGVGGLIPETHDVAQACVLLPANIGRNFIHLHRAAKKGIYESPYRRVYMRCQVDFYENARWASLLGFHPEGVEKEYVKGVDFLRFGLVRDI